MTSLRTLKLITGDAGDAGDANCLGFTQVYATRYLRNVTHVTVDCFMNVR